MSSHFLFHSSASEIVPFNAKYSFPTQASRVIESTVKIPPRTTPTMGASGAGALTSSAKGRNIQITFPAQGYLNPLESYLRFDLGITSTGADIANVGHIRPLGTIHTMFRRLRVLYGSLVLEDIQNYGTLVRMMTNVAVENDYANNSGAILEGMGSDAQRAALHAQITRGSVVLGGPTTTATAGSLAFNSPVFAATLSHSYPSPGQAALLGAGTTIPAAGSTNTVGSAPQTATLTHTYCINLCSGLLTQQKLIPLKWLANQLTIELELEEPSMFLVQGSTTEMPSMAAATSSSSEVVTEGVGYCAEIVPALYSTLPSYTAGSMARCGYFLNNIYFVAQILEFDSTYDAAFYQGMLTSGVPLKFASWHTHLHTVGGSNQAVLTIQERARSVKSGFTVVRKRGDQNPTDFTSDPYWFYPGPATQTGSNPSTWDENMAISEYQWRIGGRYFPSQSVNCLNGGAEALIELQKSLNVMGDYSIGTGIDGTNWFKPQGTFVISSEFESTNGLELSGINAEELADLALIIKAGKPFDADMFTNTFIHYDAMIIIRPNNVVELIQ